MEKPLVTYIIFFLGFVVVKLFAFDVMIYEKSLDTSLFLEGVFSGMIVTTLLYLFTGRKNLTSKKRKSFKERS